MSRPVLTERRDRVLIVTMNRPKLRNAVNLEMAQGIDAALDTLDTDPELRVGIITGAGSTFCSGMDLKAFGEGEQPYTESRGFAGIAKRGPAKPLLAAIEGYAVAGGLEIALCCDVLVADRGAQLGIPEVKRGLVAAGGALLSLPERLPYHVAIEMALTGQLLSAERAARLGLLSRVAPLGSALETALELADGIAAAAPLAVRASKRILAEAPDWPTDEKWDRQEEFAGPVRESADAKEGTLAFAEHRAPVWRGT